MKGYVPGYRAQTPTSLEQALLWLNDDPTLKPLAGATDVMVLLEAGMLKPSNWLNLWGLGEMRYIKKDSAYITLGALCTFTDIAQHDVLRGEFPMLCEAARQTGAIAIQNRGTIGGNIANASPAADSPPALLAYDAEIELVSLRGSRWMPYQNFHLGYKKMRLAEDELIGSIRLPRKGNNAIQFYRKVGTRRAQAIAKVGIAALACRVREALFDVRVAFSSVGPTPLRCIKTESLIEGRSLDGKLIEDAVATLGEEISPIDDIRSTATYRKKVAGNLLRKFLLTT